MRLGVYSYEFLSSSVLSLKVHLKSSIGNFGVSMPLIKNLVVCSSYSLGNVMVA